MTAAVRLVGTRQGCTQARDFTRRVLDDWALDHCRDDALAVVTELTTNAVLHALPADRTEGTEQAGVWLRLTLRSAHLMCSVTDQSNNLPVFPRTSDPLQEHGRGLLIVEALSQHWGWTWRSPMGKTVWAMLPTGPHT
ncbi:ATP-binding protein [Streptomyces sp. NPDC001795]|uniref:ATP-binding protein n=1 Tax=unclassified Streptomyces TaxID=2593676 RepID=UPI003320BA52